MKNRNLTVWLVVLTALFYCSCSNNSGSKLRDAAEEGNIDLVMSLLENGAEINWKDQYEGTALHRAVFKENIQMVEFLISKGANINDKIEPGLATVMKKTADEDKGKFSTVENAHGATPLHIAVDRNNIEIVKILLEHGASINEYLTVGYDFSKRKNLRKALDIARMNKNKEIENLLLQKGANSIF